MLQESQAGEPNLGEINMKDPAHVADELVEKALSPFFSEGMHPHLGHEVFCKLRKRLRLEGLPGDDHAEEVFSLIILDAYEYLNRHSGAEIRHPRGWLHAVSHNATLRYLQEVKSKNLKALMPVLHGEVACKPGASLASEESVQQFVRDAIRGLPPRYRQLIWLDLVETLPASEIRRSMNIGTDGYFRKLKSEAFSALRRALEERA
jgi:DNA-directed RNA polymerase specialized sigma24 family protein